MFQFTNWRPLQILAVVGFGGLCLPVGCNSDQQQSEAQNDSTNTGERPNIVFILADDLGWKDIGVMGSNYYQTPNIDRLAAEGMLFTDAYANAPNCAPSRACLMSGKYTPRHGVYTVNNSDRGESRLRKLIPIKNTTELDTSFITLPELLAANGYTCGHFGKWHLGADPQHGPIAHGFHYNIAGNHAGHPHSYFSPYQNPDLIDGPDGEYLTDRLNAEVLQFIEANADKPFFVYLPHYTVHTPIQGKDSLVKKYNALSGDSLHNNSGYAAMVESLDQSVGRIMAKLDKKGLSEHTIVIFFSDNGGMGHVTRMTPLRGCKGMLYEGGVRVPLIVRWPKHVKAGTTCHTPVIGIDWFPTLLHVAGVDKPADIELDGMDLMPLLTEAGQLPDRAIYWHFPAYLQGNKEFAPFRTRPAAAMRVGDYKLIEFFEDGRLELYNLQKDTGETNNLAADMPDKVQELHQQMKAWRKATKAPVPTEPNPDYQPK